MSRKPILFISDQMELGGGSTSVLNLCDGLASSGEWTASAAVTRETGFVGEQLRMLGHRVLGPFAVASLHEDRMESLYSACAKLQPQAVVAALGGDSFDFLRFVPSSVLRVAMIQSDDEQVYRKVERYAEWTDVIAGVSTEICRKIQSRVPSKAPTVCYQPYGVPMPDGRRDSNPDGKLRVLYLGRVVEEQKRISLMMNIMRTTLDAHPDIEWTVAGEGDLLDSIRSTFAKDGGRVKVPGALAYDEVPALLLQHDVYFLCSDFEGLPLSLLEAMGAGLVPVVSDLPSGISEVVHDGNGIRVPTRNERAYVDALLRLAGDPSLLTALGSQAALDVRKEHSTEAMARRWIAMLDEHTHGKRAVWKAGCKASAPLELQHAWQYHPRLRRVRKWLKSIPGNSSRKSQP